MKYKFNDGRVCTKQELKVIYYSISHFSNEREFEVWLLDEIERGVIKEVEDDYVEKVVICITKDRTTGLYNFESKSIEELSQEERDIYKDEQR
jgi:hypothetical protein